VTQPVKKMTEEVPQEQAPAPPQRMADLLKSRRNVPPNDPVITPAAPEQPAVIPESAPEVPPQETATPAENVPPESFTGNETEEQLNEVSKKSSTHNRIRTLANERNDANAKAVALQAQLDAATNAQEVQRQQLELAQGQNQPRNDMWDFKETFPEEGSPEEQEHWGIRKEVHEKTVKPLIEQQMRMTADVIAPLQREAAIRSLQTEWASVEGDMARYGTSRAELEPIVMQILTSPGGAGRNVRSVVYDTMGQMGVFDSYTPEPEAAQVPGSGNAPPIVPAETQPLHSNPRTAAMLEAKARFEANKNPQQARKSFSDVIKSQRNAHE